ncbi:two-component system OmpR family response regulator [Rhizomicrobium palustre]|uniref:Regulatory protein VirG n=1 Tax=Rhizomicrobium palustre TaxID=189966 RepID=A0A846N3J8_9PROT|nr:response regulator [Rhizomicrobium palustre]NIK89650.1 two-component system OmpR family response regulator [Rhizomicrobium palustre]
MSQTILIVEDDREISSLVEALLTREGFHARIAATGAAMDAVLLEAVPDLILLDLMLPGEDGLSICRRLRANSNVPVIMVTAKGDDIDRIIGLEVGADDYVAKPFNPRELIARIRAVLRRAVPAAIGPSIQVSRRMWFGDFTLDLDAHRLFRGAEEIELSTGDFDLLSVLVEHPMKVLSRDQLMDLTKGRSWDVFDRSIDVALSRLRKKIETDPAHPVLIKTIRNAGYMLAVPAGKV